MLREAEMNIAFENSATINRAAVLPRQKLISIVVAMHNEQASLDMLFRALSEVLQRLSFRCEIVCVNDGSTDGTLAGLFESQNRDRRIRIVDLTRNFGKEAAMTAGLDHANGDAVILIDADLQDPPSLIETFVKHWLDGYEVVYGVRASRPDDSLAKRTSAIGFYKFFNTLTETRIPQNAGDFRLMDRRVVDALLALPEKNRFMKGLYAWVGFKQIGVTFVRQPRAAGLSSWSYWKLFNFAIDAITSFSTVPLRIASAVGAAVSIAGLSYATYLIVRTILDGIDVPGYASVMVAILFLGGIQLLALGVIGEYIGRLYLEAKDRPLYLVSHVYDHERDRISTIACTNQSPIDGVHSIAV